MRTTELTSKQTRFVEEYLLDMNATRAAERAGYSVRSAGKIGHQLLEKTRVAEAIRAAQDERSRRTRIDADSVLEAIATRAFTGLSRFVRIYDDGQPALDLSRCSPQELDCVTELQSEVRTVESECGIGRVSRSRIKLGSQDRSLEFLARHLGLLKDKLELEVLSLSEEDREERVLKILERARQRSYEDEKA